MQNKHTTGGWLKKLTAVFMAAAIVIGAIGFTNVQAASTSAPRIRVAGHYVQFEGTQPIHQGGVIHVPVRGVFTLMGFEPTWDGPNNTATLFDGQTRIVIPIGQPTFTVNGRVVTPEVPQKNVGGRVLIPLRAITEAIGGTADWDSVNRVAVIAPPPELLDRVLANIGAGTAPSIITTGFTAGTVGQPFNQSLHATVAGTVTWGIASGTLPPGLSLNITTGAITGTPTTNGTFNFTVIAQNVFGSNSRALSITIGAVTPTPSPLPNRRLTTAERDNWIASYRAAGGATAMELEVIRLINIERASRNLVQVQLDEPLMMAARFFAQQHNDLRGLYTEGHNFGPYATTATAAHGASANVAAAFGATLRWNGGNWHSSGTTAAQALVNSWMNSAGHRNYILSPEHRFIGIGQFPGGVSYLFMNDVASAQQFTVTFNANGGTGTMQAQTFQRNTAQDLRTNTFTRAGHVFLGWRTGPTGTTAQYTDGQRVTINANRTMYAVWGQGYSVTFNANGGTGTMAPQVFQRNVWQDLRANTFTRTGHTFAGWRSTPTGSAQYNDGHRISIAANRTLYAVWTPGYTVTFDANGGTGTMAAQNFTRNVAQHLRVNTFTRQGFTFMGWATTPFGTVQHQNEALVTVDSSRTLYAVWVSGNAPVVAIPPAGAMTATVGVPFAHQFTATGAGPITWDVIAGSWPPWITSFNPNTGEVSGTPTAGTTPRSYTFTMRARNNSGDGTREFTITVQAAANVQLTNVVNQARAVVEPYLSAPPRNFTVIVNEVHNATVSAGYVINQSPGAGMIAPGSTVTITVSLGPDPNTATSIASVSQASIIEGEVFNNSMLIVTVNTIGGNTRTVTAFTTNIAPGTPLTEGTYSLAVTYGSLAPYATTLTVSAAPPGA